MVGQQILVLPAGVLNVLYLDGHVEFVSYDRYGEAPVNDSAALTMSLAAY